MDRFLTDVNKHFSEELYCMPEVSRFGVIFKLCCQVNSSLDILKYLKNYLIMMSNLYETVLYPEAYKTLMYGMDYGRTTLTSNIMLVFCNEGRCMYTQCKSSM